MTSEQIVKALMVRRDGVSREAARLIEMQSQRIKKLEGEKK